MWSTVNSKDPTHQIADLDQAMDRLFDRELSPEEQDRLAEELKRDPAALRRFRQMTDVLLALREPTEAPDLTDAVLRRLRERARLMPGCARRPRVLTPGRVAAAAAIIAAVAGMTLLGRSLQPRATVGDLARTPAPDPRVERMLDPQLAERELAAIRSDAAASFDRGSLLSHARTSVLRERPLRLSLSPIDGFSGAGDWAGIGLPYELTSELLLPGELNAGSDRPFPAGPQVPAMDPGRFDWWTDRPRPLLRGPSLELRLEPAGSESKRTD
ncbi:MAG: hypothetical protein Kow0022_13040 [Phycisphaerales bacterium]